MKKTYTGNNRQSQTLQMTMAMTTAYYAAKEKWKLTTECDLTMMTQVICLDSHEIDNSWVHYNTIGFESIKAGFLNFVLIFGLFINSTFSLFLEVIAKLNVKTKLESVYCTCIEFGILGSSIFLIRCSGC